MNRLNGRFAAQQILGGRAYQQDGYGLIERGDPDIDDSEVLILADGMGGYFGGDIASRTEETKHPCQDNTTVLLYRPEADCGSGMLPKKPREPRPETGLSRLWSAFKKMLTKSPGQQSNLTS